MHVNLSGKCKERISIRNVVHFSNLTCRKIEIAKWVDNQIVSEIRISAVTFEETERVRFNVVAIWVNTAPSALLHLEDDLNIALTNRVV